MEIVGCLFVLLLVTSLVLGVIAFVRSGRIRHLEQRVTNLGRQIDALRSELKANRERAPEATPREAREEMPERRRESPEDIAPPPLPPAATREETPGGGEPPTPLDAGLGVTAPEPQEESKGKPTPLPPTPPSPTRPALKEKLGAVDWERWIGVRGAAVVGGIVLALAAILFFRHAFERGWIQPSVRVAIGVASGIALIGGGWFTRRRGFRWAPDALAGAGIVALYATIWAADKRYSMISIAASFPLMAVVTALACVIAVRFRSLFAVLLGLVGGFATPLLLTTGENRPLSFFGYILLLDLGLVFVGRKRKWPSIGILALLGTFLMEGLWIWRGMETGQSFLGLAILAVFAVLFAFSGGLAGRAVQRSWIPAQAGAILFPFVFALYFAGEVDFRGHVWPVALLLGLLLIGAIVVGRTHQLPWLAAGAAGAGVAVTGVWLLELRPVLREAAWELAFVALGLALVAHLAAEWERVRERSAEKPDRTLAYAASGSAGAWALLLWMASGSVEVAAFWPLVVGIVPLAALLVRDAQLTKRAPILFVGVAGLALTLLSYQIVVGFPAPGGSSPPDPRLFAGLLVLLALGYLGTGAWLRDSVGRAALHGAGVFLVVQSFGLLETDYFHDPHSWLGAATILAFTLLFVAVAVSSRRGAWLGTGVVIGAVLHTWGVFDRVEVNADPIWSEPELVSGGILVLIGAALLLFAPSLFLRRLHQRPWAWRTASWTGALWLLPIAWLYEERFGDDLPLLPPALLALVMGLVIATFVRRFPAEHHAVRQVALAWYGGVACSLVALAVCLQIDTDWPLLTFAVSAALLAWLAHRLEHRGLAWVAISANTLAIVSICISGLASGHYERSDWPLLNWIAYANLIPAATSLAVHFLLKRLPPAETAPKPLRVMHAILPGLGAMIAIFLWINLEILNHFSKGEYLAIDLERMPARDLTTSIAWGIYALVLLLLGTWKRTSAMRWASLALFFLSIGKVFLYDLGHLEGMYRVGSLTALAMALIVVSLFYQRFVFRK